MEELSDRPEYCLDLTFMYSLLSLGYELEEERQVWMGKKVGDVELGWCVIFLSLTVLVLTPYSLSDRALGAALALIEGSVSCRAPAA
jgi:guanosine-diphosphatase